MLGVTRVRVYQLIDAGLLPTVQTACGTTLIPVRAIEQRKKNLKNPRIAP